MGVRWGVCGDWSNYGEVDAREVEGDEFSLQHMRFWEFHDTLRRRVRVKEVEVWGLVREELAREIEGELMAEEGDCWNEEVEASADH